MYKNEILDENEIFNSKSYYENFSRKDISYKSYIEYMKNISKTEKYKNFSKKDKILHEEIY